MGTDVEDELHSMVLGIVNEIEAAADGRLYKAGNGGFNIIDDIDEWKEERYKEKADKFREEHPESGFDSEEYGFDTYEEWMEDEIGTADDIDEPEEVSLADYVSDQALGDTRYEVDSEKDLNGARTLFTCGGPTIWVYDDRVEGFWGHGHVEMSLDSDAARAMYDMFEEWWETIK